MITQYCPPLVAERTTTDSVTTTLGMYQTSPGALGTFEIDMFAFDTLNGNSLYGKKIVNWKNVSGNVVIIRNIDLIVTQADGTISTATWVIDSSGANLRARITGNARNIRWSVMADLIVWNTN